MKELVIAEIIKLIIFRTFRSDTKASYRASAELIPAGHRIEVVKQVREKEKEYKNPGIIHLLTYSRFPSIFKPYYTATQQHERI